MHEASIAQGILNTVLSACCDEQYRITKVNVVAGALTGVSVAGLEMFWNELRRGTQAQNADIAITIKPAVLVCHNCNEKFDHVSGRPIEVICGTCGGQLKLEADYDLFVESMEVEEC